VYYGYELIENLNGKLLEGLGMASLCRVPTLDVRKIILDEIQWNNNSYFCALWLCINREHCTWRSLGDAQVWPHQGLEIVLARGGSSMGSLLVGAC
jgi:hypothetical protein